MLYKEIEKQDMCWLIKNKCGYYRGNNYKEILSGAEAYYIT